MWIVLGNTTAEETAYRDEDEECPFWAGNSKEARVVGVEGGGK